MIEQQKQKACKCETSCKCSETCQCGTKCQCGKTCYCCSTEQCNIKNVCWTGILLIIIAVLFTSAICVYLLKKNKNNISPIISKQANIKQNIETPTNEAKSEIIKTFRLE